MMTPIVAPLGCLSRASTASCLVPLWLGEMGVFAAFTGRIARLLAREGLVLLDVLLCDIFGSLW